MIVSQSTLSKLLPCTKNVTFRRRLQTFRPRLIPVRQPRHLHLLNFNLQLEKIEQASNELIAVSQLYNAYPPHSVASSLFRCFPACSIHLPLLGHFLLFFASILWTGGDFRVQTSCYSKCINKKFYEGELTTGEGVCLDRCVSKFFATHHKMNEVSLHDR